MSCFTRRNMRGIVPNRNFYKKRAMKLLHPLFVFAFLRVPGVLVCCAIIFERLDRPFAKVFIATESMEKKSISQGSLRALWLSGRYL